MGFEENSYLNTEKMKANTNVFTCETGKTQMERYKDDKRYKDDERCKDDKRCNDDKRGTDDATGEKVSAYDYCPLGVVLKLFLVKL